MLDGIEAGLDAPSGHNSRPCGAQLSFYFKSNERLILDDLDQPSGERNARHNEPPRWLHLSKHPVSTAGLSGVTAMVRLPG
jgi:hypothetical protein